MPLLAPTLVLRTSTVVVFAGALALAGVVLVAGSSARAQNLEIDVTPEQKVTLVGQSSSLRDTVAELCRLGGVDLHTYDAEDRPVAANFTEAPLSEVLERLLRQEAYLVGLREPDDGSAPRVTWLRITGANRGVPGAGYTPPPPPASGPPETPFGVSEAVLQNALASEDQKERDKAVASVIEFFRDNPESLEELAHHDVASLVESIYHYPHALKLLQGLQNAQVEYVRRMKIEGIIQSLKFRQRRTDLAPPEADAGTAVADQ